jgi:DNA-binding CsgD family transcriptional regulator
VEVLRLASEGRSAKEIARVLGISVRTVEGHFGAMRDRTGARNMAELVIWGARCGLISPQPASSQVAKPRPAEGPDDGNRPETGSPKEVTRRFPDPPDALGYAMRRPAGRKGGRPAVVTPEVAAQVRMLLGSYTVKQIAAKLGISRSTLYAHMHVIKLDGVAAGVDSEEPTSR